MEHFVVEKVWLREMARNVAAQITPYDELQYKCDATEAWDNWKIEVEGLFNFHILFLLFNMSNERLELKYFLFYISFHSSFATSHGMSYFLGWTHALLNLQWPLRNVTSLKHV